MLANAVKNAQNYSLLNHYTNAGLNTKGPRLKDSAVYLHLKDKGHSFNENHVHIMFCHGADTGNKSFGPRCRHEVKLAVQKKKINKVQQTGENPSIQTDSINPYYERV